MTRYIHSRRGPHALTREHAAETPEAARERMASIVRANLATIDRLAASGRLSVDDAVTMRAAERARLEVL